MSTASPFKSILLIGAGGSIGTVVLQALLAEPSLTVTILKRSNSTTPLPPNIPSITIPPTYPTEALISAFRGHDAIISCMTTLSVADQFRFIDAAIAAGVRRYIPSEYGLNNMNPAAQALNAVFRDKGAVQQYLRDRAAEGKIEWMSISCGMWITWSMAHDFLGLKVREKKFTMWDDGEGRFSISTEENTALGLVRALVVKWEETRNRNVLISEFVTTQRELLAEVERQVGERFVVERVDSRERIRELQARYEEGNGGAVYGLIEAGFVTGRFGADLEAEGELFNEVLGLRGHTLREVVAGALGGKERSVFGLGEVLGRE